jgi:hypothetical protein
LELRTVGSTLTVKLNEKTIGQVRDDRVNKGSFGVQQEGGKPDAKIKALDFLNLDPPGGASVAPGATPATATKDAPFLNGLGMKFVPVPITGGPTGGHRVLFSVWETRVQDYAVFAKETKREWPKVDFPQDAATHPAVNLNYQDAQDFCTWLTKRERKAGILGAHEVYRLPSDHEWSSARGIGEREDPAKSPSEKNQQGKDDYP